MRRFGWGVLAGVLVGGMVPAGANTIAWEETMTYYTYIYHPSEATTYVIDTGQADSEKRELDNPWVSPAFYVNMGLPGAYEGQAAGRVISFSYLSTEVYENDNWYTMHSPTNDLNVSGGYLNAGLYTVSTEYDEAGNPTGEEQAIYGEAASRGFIEFGLDMSIVSWSLGTGINFFFCQFSGGIGQDAGEACDGYGYGTSQDQGLENPTHLALLYYFTEAAGWWEMVEEQAIRFVWYENDWSEDEEDRGPPSLSFFVDKESNGGGVIIPGDPGDLGGGGGLPGPVPLSPVPLPASVLLLLSGLGALGAGGVWRRRRAAA